MTPSAWLLLPKALWTKSPRCSSESGVAVQAGTGTTSAKDRTYLNEEYKALMLEIDRIADNTEGTAERFSTATLAAPTSPKLPFRSGLARSRLSHCLLETLLMPLARR